jgi:hypothetical protein
MYLLLYPGLSPVPIHVRTVMLLSIVRSILYFIFSTYMPYCLTIFTYVSLSLSYSTYLLSFFLHVSISCTPAFLCTYILPYCHAYSIHYNSPLSTYRLQSFTIFFLLTLYPTFTCFLLLYMSISL